MSLVVLKFGGRVAIEEADRARALHDRGDGVVVVHGAGPQITAELERRGIEATFVDGRRVTTPVILDVVREALQRVNDELCAAIGPDAIGLMGDRIGLTAEPVVALGLVGDPEPSSPPAVTAALAEGRVPVVAPLAEGPLNVNADEAAAALAVGLDADEIVFVTDVAGVLVENAVVPRFTAEEAADRLAAGAFAGGIVPKLTAAVLAARGGVRASIGATEVVA